MDEQKKDRAWVKISLDRTISIADIFTIIMLVVTMTIAVVKFDARLEALEQKSLELKKQNNRNKAESKTELLRLRSEIKDELKLINANLNQLLIRLYERTDGTTRRR